MAGGRWSPDEGLAATRSILRTRRPPTALVSSSVELALGALAAARELGLRVPDELAVATFDDAYFAELLDPPLTAVAYDPAAVGRRAAELLVGAMRDGEEPRRDERIAVELVRRRSCGCGPMSATAPAIRLAGVSKMYGSQVALQATDLEIAEGEFFCLLGPSGCGKTTTLNLIGGFVNATSGEIFIRDERVDRLPPHRRSVNTVFQSYALFPHMTVRANVGFGLKMARVPSSESKERVAEALRLVGLEDFGDRLPGQLSGGQQQRVAVARALVNRPAVLLLDEPLGALDLKLRHRLQVELSQIHRDVGTTFVYVTHDQEEAMSMATRIAVMSEGRVQQIGSPSEIYHQPRSRFVADFIGESNFLEVESAAARRGPARGRARRALLDERCRGRPRGADGAARVDPHRRPGRRAGRAAARTDRADLVPRQPDPHRRQVRRGRGAVDGFAVRSRADRRPRPCPRPGARALVGAGRRSAVAGRTH